MAYPTGVFHRTTSRCLVLQGFQRAASPRFPSTKKYRSLTASDACPISISRSISLQHHCRSRTRDVFRLNLRMDGSLKQALPLSVWFGTLQLIRKIVSYWRDNGWILSHCFSILRFEVRYYRQGPSDWQARMPQQCHPNIVTKPPLRMSGDRLDDLGRTVWTVQHGQ